MQQPRLLERVRAATRMRHYSIRTAEAYVRWTEWFVRFDALRHPSELGAAEIEAFPAHLAVKEHASLGIHHPARGSAAYCGMKTTSDGPTR